MDPFLFFQFPQTIASTNIRRASPPLPGRRNRGVEIEPPVHTDLPWGGIEAQDPVQHTPLAAPRRTTVSSSGGVVRIRNKGGHRAQEEPRPDQPVSANRWTAGFPGITNTLRRAIIVRGRPAQRGTERLVFTHRQTNSGLQPGQDENDHRVRTILEPSVPAGALTRGLDRASAPRVRCCIYVGLKRRRPVGAGLASHRTASSGLQHLLNRSNYSPGFFVALRAAGWLVIRASLECLPATGLLNFFAPTTSVRRRSGGGHGQEASIG